MLTATGTAAAADSRQFRFTYEFELTPPPDADKIAVWIPLPIESDAQAISDMHIDSSVPFKVTKEHVYGNRMIYLERHGDPRTPLSATVRFRVDRREYAGAPAARPSSRYVSANKLVPTTGLIKQISDRTTADKTTTMEKARAIYDFVVDRMRYDKSGTGWGHGDALFACTKKKGNCTDFHALFIAMARAAGIPARFEIGFPIPRNAHEGTIPGYHCWAEFWEAGRGWIPVDASEAHKHPEQREYLFGHLDPNRVQMTTGRDILLSPRQAGEPLNYFVYPYVEINDRPLQDSDSKRVTVRFSFADETSEASNEAPAR
ncbi:MAG: hypothetical protein D6760_04320 [Deltaproteobacteria bacterium]|nr:MAG: hypothetical protein D6760_04320 [Deltaproteobacteria bacterium]